VDWTKAIARKHYELQSLIASLCVLMAITNAASSTARGRCIVAMLHIVRPTESALRRLIVIVAARMHASGQSICVNQKTQTMIFLSERKSSGQMKERIPAFCLFDKRKRFGRIDHGYASRARLRAQPRIWVAGITNPNRPGSTRCRSHPSVSAQRVAQRIRAMARAIETLPAQTRRLMRVLENRSHRPPGPRRIGPLRPGLPPAWRRNARHPSDHTLADCALLAQASGFVPP